LGYHVVGTSFDPDDSKNHDDIGTMRNYVTDTLQNCGPDDSFIANMHGTYKLVAIDLIPFAIREVQKKGFKGKRRSLTGIIEGEIKSKY
jgi:hypothetical protein